MGICGKVIYSAMELCGRGQTIPEPDRLGQSVGLAPICLRPPIPPPSTGCRQFGADSGPMSAYCATTSGSLEFGPAYRLEWLE